MIILTSLCGGDGNALKRDGIRREDRNASPAALINTPPSAENLKLKAGMPSQERPLIYSSACACFITAAAGNLSAEQMIPLFVLSVHHSLVSFFLSSFLILASARWSTHLHLLCSFVCRSSPPLLLLLLLRTCPWCRSAANTSAAASASSPLQASTSRRGRM